MRYLGLIFLKLKLLQLFRFGNYSVAIGDTVEKDSVNIKYWASDLKNIPITWLLFWKKKKLEKQETKYDHFLKCTLLFFLMCDIYFVCESKFPKICLSLTVTLCSYFMSNLIIPRYLVGWVFCPPVLSPSLCFCSGRNFFLNFWQVT